MLIVPDLIAKKNDKRKINANTDIGIRINYKISVKILKGGNQNL
jgi:hypothetical protein